MHDASSLERAAERPGHGSRLGTLAGSSESLVDSPGQESARFTTRSNLADQALVLRDTVRAEDVERDARAVRLVPETPLLRSDSTRRLGLGRRSLLPDGPLPSRVACHSWTMGADVPSARAPDVELETALPTRDPRSRLRGRWSRGMTALPG